MCQWLCRRVQLLRNRNLSLWRRLFVRLLCGDIRFHFDVGHGWGLFVSKWLCDEKQVVLPEARHRGQVDLSVFKR